MAETNGGYLALLLQSMLDSNREVREEIRLTRAAIAALPARIAESETRLLTYLASSSQTRDRTGDPLGTIDHLFSILPLIGRAILWGWHAVIWIIPMLLGGWGLVEGWLAIASHWVKAIAH